ncbi:MAG: beta-ketoacyl-ACP synthase III [Pseudomonadota bacterium]
MSGDIVSVVEGCGGYVPDRILTNAEIATFVDTTDDWIQSRTGISERRVVSDDESTSDLGVRAAQAAMADAGVDADDIDLIIVATTTPDLTFPATAAIIQRKLAVARGAAFDVQAVCSGFVYALTTADMFLKSGSHQCALVIGAETMSRLMDWNDRTTCVLFGDGAGAVVLRAEERPHTNGADRGVLATHLRTDGQFTELLFVDGGASSTQDTGFLRMQGNQVFRRAVDLISDAVRVAANDAQIAVTDIDWFVPHQANKRIIDAVGRKLGIRAESVVETVAHHGNTSAASIPLALHAAVSDGRIKRGDLVMMEAMGGGLSWGAALVRY